MLSHRVELIAASLHWAHCEHAVEVEVTPLGGGRARVACKLTAFGDSWEPYPVPQEAHLTLEGALALTDDRCCVSFQGGPLTELAFDPRVPRVELLLGPGLDDAPPPYCTALLSWARSTGALK